MTQVVNDPRAFRGACEAARKGGHRVGVVPTMGALHDGHLQLIDVAKERGATWRAVTVFVNPLQFAEGEDLDRYPRTLAHDVAACELRGVDLVFAPKPESMYPSGFQTQVRVTELTERLEGSFRPGHFDGVTTVVTKLFNLVGTSIAVFGRKDFQQFKVIERMAQDLDFPVKIIGAPIVREDDGLALSSRNRYLDADERRRALALIGGLRAAEAGWLRGERNPSTLTSLCRDPIEAAFDRIDYVTLANRETLAPWDGTANAVLLVAAHLGSTRLIDNLELTA